MIKVLNVLIIENSVDEISKARKAFIYSFKELNKRAKLNIDINIFPKPEQEEEFSGVLSKYAADSKEFSDYNIVVNYIKEQFENLEINVFLLDFLLSNDEEEEYGDKNERINDSSGAKILQLIRKTKYKKIPCIGYTQLKNQVQELKIACAGPLFQMDKTFVGDKYFIENQGHLYTMLSEANIYQDGIENQCDIVVICALKKEIKPIINLLETQEVKDATETFTKGYIENKGNKKLKVVAVTKEQMGMAEAATLTTQMIEKYNPSYVVMTGIAGGIDADKQNFLDILMPSYIHNWQSGKYKETKDDIEREKTLHVFEREFSSVETYIKDKTDLTIDEKYLKVFPEDFLISEKFKGDFNRENIEKYLGVIEKKLEKDRSEFEQEIIVLKQKQKEKLESELHALNKSRKNNKKEEIIALKEKFDNFSKNNSAIDFIFNMVSKLACTIEKDGMVSGSAVVADGHIVKEHIDKRKINGIDMEAYGVAYACNKHPTKPKVVILKAICDFADSNKNDIYQSAAAFVSAQAFYKLFTDVIDMEQDT